MLRYTRSGGHPSVIYVLHKVSDVATSLTRIPYPDSSAGWTNLANLEFEFVPTFSDAPPPSTASAPGDPYIQAALV